MTKTYQLTYLISPELSFEQAQAVSQDVAATIKKEGEIINTKKPSRKSLAYPIRKQRAAYVADVKLNLDPQKTEKVRKEIEKNPRTLRCLVLQKQAKKPAPPLKTQKPKEAKAPGQKVELKEIEEKLDEILDFPHDPPKF